MIVIWSLLKTLGGFVFDYFFAIKLLAVNCEFDFNCIH